MKDAKGHGSNLRGAAAGGVEQVGTKPMLSPESETSRELRTFANNNSDLYRHSFMPVVNNLGKKMDKGTYDSDKATKALGIPRGSRCTGVHQTVR